MSNLSSADVIQLLPDHAIRLQISNNPETLRRFIAGELAPGVVVVTGDEWTRVLALAGELALPPANFVRHLLLQALYQRAHAAAIGLKQQDRRRRRGDVS